MDKHLSTVSPTEPKRVHQASRTNLASSQSRSTVLRVRDPYPLARPDSFPIRAEGFVERRCSPWSHYRKTYRLRFGVNVWFTAAQQMNKPCDEVFVQELPAKIGKKELRHFLELRHPHIHTVLALFSTDETRFIVLEYLEVSLHEIATVGINTAELAALLGQVLDGLVYLTTQNLEHSSMTCSNTLISKDGIVKITQCEHCITDTATAHERRTANVVAIGSITAQLMGGHIKAKGIACLPDLERWHPDAATFLAQTNSVVLVQELQEHKFLRLACKTEQLKSVVSKVIRTARIQLEEV